MLIAPAYVTTLYLPTEEGEGEGSIPVRKKARVASVCQWSKKAKLAIRPKLFTFNTLYTFFTFFPFSFFSPCFLPRHLFLQERGCHVTCAVLHKPSGLMVVGFSSGVFSLHEMPDFNPIHTLRCAQL